MNVNKVLTYVLIFSLVLLICYVIYYITKMLSIKEEKEVEKFDQQTPASKRNRIVGFFMSGCPYCVQFKPVFDNVLSEYTKNEKFNKDWSVSAEDDTLRAKTNYNITSFPSVVIIQNDKVVEVKAGSMGEVEFRQFLNTYIVPAV
jgi:thiol-disulfide isomerase/thioredoxin